jgi:ABC-type nitrate/sulfonate/bicarbonate transport system permease component
MDNKTEQITKIYKIGIKYYFIRNIGILIWISFLYLLMRWDKKDVFFISIIAFPIIIIVSIFQWINTKNKYKKIKENSEEKG